MEISKPQTTPSAWSLGLSFLLAGIGFALPLYLFPGLSYATQIGRAPEVMNLFCLVAWMGLSHFSFAYTGHIKACLKQKFSLPLYLIILILSLIAFFVLRMQIGIAIFSAIAWIYFISHLIKAELYFSNIRDWKVFLVPLFAFSFFSFALLAPDDWVRIRYLFIGVAICLSPFLAKSVRGYLKSSFSVPLLLIAMFLIGEGLIWGKYRPFMSPEFRDGVYTIHVALASFYHYFKSYHHMLLRNQGSISKIVAINVGIISLGVLCLRFGEATPLIFLFGAQYFTVWVFLHQWMSDCFNWLKKAS